MPRVQEARPYRSSIHSLRPNYTFLDQIKVLALMGYTQASEADEADLYPIARAWLLENLDPMDQDDRKTRTAPHIWTRSICSQVIEWAEFNRDCNAALECASRKNPLELAAELWRDRGVELPTAPTGNVIPFPRANGSIGYTNKGPAA